MMFQTVIALTSPSIRTTATIIGFHTSSKLILEFYTFHLQTSLSCTVAWVLLASIPGCLLFSHVVGMWIEYNIFFGCNSVYPKCFVALEIKATVQHSEWVTILVMWLVKLLESDWLFQHSSRFKENSPDVMIFLCYILPVYTLDVIHIMKCIRLSLSFFLFFRLCLHRSRRAERKKRKKNPGALILWVISGGFEVDIGRWGPQLIEQVLDQFTV